MSGRPRLVVLRALGLGDYLTGIPALRGLAVAFPDHRRLLVAPAGIAALARHVGLIEAVVDTPRLVPLAPALHQPDVAVDLHGRGPESQRLLLDCRPDRLVSFTHAQVPATLGAPHWRADEHEVWRWCRMLSESGIPADPSRLDIQAPPRPVATQVRGATVVHPGAASPARRWPPERWAAVARAEMACGRKVVITGNQGEAQLAGRVAAMAGLGPTAVLAGRTDLLGLAAVVAASDRVVSGDTGVAHLATALGTPSVVLFGPVSPAHWGPPRDRPWHRALWAGETGDPHGQQVDAGLLAVSVNDVLHALADLPGRPPSAGAATALADLPGRPMPDLSNRGFPGTLAG